MKRYIKSGRTLKSMDPWELREAGWKIVDGGYASGRDDYEAIKKDMIRKYGPNTKIYRDATDTPGLIMYSVYAPIDKVQGSSYDQGRPIRPEFEEQRKTSKAITRRVNYQLALDILNNLSESKKVQLDKMLSRNAALTSSYCCSFGTLRVYKEGFYLTLEATRSQFSVWVYDEDGELVEGRKPNESKLNFLYEQSLNFNQLGESDWAAFVR